MNQIVELQGGCWCLIDVYGMFMLLARFCWVFTVTVTTRLHSLAAKADQSCALLAPLTPYSDLAQPSPETSNMGFLCHTSPGSDPLLFSLKTQATLARSEPPFLKPAQPELTTSPP